jgi:hypothetical protein
MADKKISALTGATTPLAGTEVLPIVQGGATVKVAVSDLTAGRTVSANSLAVGLTTPVSVLDVQGTVSDTVNRTNAQMAVGNFASLGAGLLGQQTASAPYGFSLQAANAANSVQFPLNLNPSGGDVKIGANIIPATAAKGVNFTANTPNGGMTSQLLNWYEEGVVTVTLTASGSGTITMNGSYNTMRYVRIGRQVTVIGHIAVSSVSSPTGALLLNGMPFTSATGESFKGSVSILANALAVTATTQITGLINSASTTLTLYKYVAGSVANLAADVQAGSELYVTATYFV